MKAQRWFYYSIGLVCLGAALIFFWGKIPAQPITRTFAAQGISKVILRAGQANAVSVSIVNDQTIRVSGLPAGGAKGYHPANPLWRETPAKNWGLDFVSKRYGSTLVISTKNEIRYIHHHYVLSHITIKISKGVMVIKEDRNLNGDGAPDLKPPK